MDEEKGWKEDKGAVNPSLKTICSHRQLTDSSVPLEARVNSLKNEIDELRELTLSIKTSLEQKNLL